MIDERKKDNRRMKDRDIDNVSKVVEEGGMKANKSQTQVSFFSNFSVIISLKIKQTKHLIQMFYESTQTFVRCSHALSIVCLWFPFYGFLFPQTWWLTGEAKLSPFSSQLVIYRQFVTPLDVWYWRKRYPPASVWNDLGSHKPVCVGKRRA